MLMWSISRISQNKWADFQTAVKRKQNIMSIFIGNLILHVNSSKTTILNADLVIKT
jgi:hypothetical protein